MKKLIGCAVLGLMLCAASPFIPSIVAVEKNQDQLRSLTGHVIDRQEQAVPKAIVYLKNTKTLIVKTYITEPNGSYRFPALSTNVDYEVHAEYKGEHSDTKTLSSFDSRKEPIINLKINK